MARPPRLAGFSYTGVYRYFLTICTLDRAPTFTERRCVDLAHAQLLRAAKKHKFEIPVSCYMPDHLHVLGVAAASDADFVAFVNLVKQLSSYYFKREFKRPLWQDGLYELVLREDEDTAGVMAYIIMNPVRAGLVVNPTDYPFWGSETHSREQLLEFVGTALANGVRRP